MSAGGRRNSMGHRFRPGRQHIFIRLRLPGAILRLEQHSAALERTQAVPLSGRDIQHVAARNHIHRLHERPGSIIEVLLEMAAKAYDYLVGGAVPMHRKHRPRLNRIEHPLAPVLRAVPQVVIHPQPRRSLGRSGEGVEDGVGDDHGLF